MFETEFCTIAYLEDHNAVLCRWKKYCSFEDYRLPLESGLQLINEKEATPVDHGYDQWL